MSPLNGSGGVIIDRDQAKAIAQKHLEPAEELIWWGPVSRKATRHPIWAYVLPLVAAALFLALFTTASGASWSGYLEGWQRRDPDALLIPGFFVVTYVIGVLVTWLNGRLTPPDAPRDALLRRVYAITDQRLLVIDENDVRSYQRHDIGLPYVRNRSKGRPSDVLFDPEGSRAFHDTVARTAGRIPGPTTMAELAAHTTRIRRGGWGFTAVDSPLVVRDLIKGWLEEGANHEAAESRKTDGGTVREEPRDRAEGP